MNYPLVVAASLASTVFFAVSTVLKHHSATRLPATRGNSAVRAGRFVTSTLRSPWWLGGMAADGGGLTLQAYALHIGAVSVVQPLLVTALLTSLVTSHVSTRRCNGSSNRAPTTYRKCDSIAIRTAVSRVCNNRSTEMAPVTAPSTAMEIDTP